MALIDGNQDGALEAAKAAVAADVSLPAAQYQLGLALEARGENPAAADAFAKAAEANPQMAYGHYNAGMNYYKAKRIIAWRSTSRTFSSWRRTRPRSRPWNRSCARCAAGNSVPTDQNAWPSPKSVVHVGSNGRRLSGTALSRRSSPTGV